MRILSGQPQDAAWHLFDRCEWCEFFDHCREEMRQCDDVSRLVQLTTYGKRHLREEAGVQTLTELGQFLTRADADEVLDRCASLSGQRHRLQKHVEALATDTPQLHGAASPDLPRGENVAVFLTLQREPLGQAIYLAGVHVQVRDDLRSELLSPAVAGKLLGPQGKMQPAIWLAERPEDVAAVRRRLIELLDDLFRRLHDYNVHHPEWHDQLSLQAYVHTEQERALLFTALLEALREPDLAEAAMTLLFHFQGPELIQAPRHPTSEVAYPVVVLHQAVSRLLALPVEVSYTLPEMLQALGSAFSYQRRDYFHFPLGHGLRAEALHGAWYRGQHDNLGEIQRTGPALFASFGGTAALGPGACGRVFVCLAAKVYAARRRRHPPAAFVPAGLLCPLRKPATLPGHPRSAAEARPTQVLLGQVIELRARTPTEMEVVGNLVVEPEADNFPAWLLVRDSDDGRRAPRSSTAITGIATRCTAAPTATSAPSPASRTSPPIPRVRPCFA